MMIAGCCSCGHSHCPYCGHAIPDRWPYGAYPWPYQPYCPPPWKYVRPAVPYWNEPVVTWTANTTYTVTAHDPVRAAVNALAG